MCRNLLYTVDSDRMQKWLWQQHKWSRRLIAEPLSTVAPHPIDGQVAQVRHLLHDDANVGNVGEEWAFLTDPQREEALRSWARGTLTHPPRGTQPGNGEVVPATAPLASIDTVAAWMPHRQIVMLHAQVVAEAQAALLERGHAVRSAAGQPSRAVQRAERFFMDSLKPLLGIWYGRLMLLRVPGHPWLLAQADARVWTGWLGRDASCAEPGNDRERPEHYDCNGLLICPPPGSVLWRGGDVVEMFGARDNDMCCCSLVESPDDPEVAALEANFLDALGVVLSSSVAGTVFIDVDADYAEPA